MSAAALVLGVLLAVGVVVLVALPFLREPVAENDQLDAPGEAEERHLALLEARDRALVALKELEFDHRTGKIADADYRALVAPLRQDAARALRALDREQGHAPATDTPEPAPEPATPPGEAAISSTQE